MAPPDRDECLGVGVFKLAELGWAGTDDVVFTVVDAQCVNELFP